MKAEWFKKTSLTFREIAWIFNGFDPDEVGQANRDHPTEPIRQGSVPARIIDRFSDYLYWLDLLYRDVALGIIPMTREPWNRFALCFVRTGHLVRWAETTAPEKAKLWMEHGVVGEPLPPPPAEWISPAGESLPLAKMRQQMIHRAAIRQLYPMMKDEMALLQDWFIALHDSAAAVPLDEIKTTLRPLYKVLRNLPVLKT